MHNQSQAFSEQAEDQQSVLIKLLLEQNSLLQRNNAILQTRVDQAESIHRAEMDQREALHSQQLAAMQQQHEGLLAMLMTLSQTQMDQHENHHKELLSKLSVEDKSENYSAEVQQEIDVPNSVISASSESLQSLPIAGLCVSEVVPNDEVLVKQFSKEDDPVNLLSLVEICQTYGKFVVGKQETDTTFSTHSNISYGKFMTKVFENNKNSRQPCFISKFNLSKVSELKQLIDACPTDYLKSVVIHNCQRWSRLLVNNSNPENVALIDDFLFIRTLIIKYGSKASLRFFTGDIPDYNHDAKERAIEKANRDAYLSVCQSNNNALGFKTAFSEALDEENFERLLLLVTYGLGAFDLYCEKLLCERGVPKKTDNGVWQFSGIKLTALLFLKSVRQGCYNKKNNVDTINVLAMLCERGYGEQAVACLDNEFYTSLDSHAAAFLFQKVPLCRLRVLQEIFLNKNHRRHYEDDVVVAQRQSKFESNFIQSIGTGYLMDLSQLLSCCVNNTIKHAVILRLLEVDSLHEIYDSLRQSKAIDAVDLLRLFCFSFDGVAKKEHLEKAQLLQKADPSIYHVIHEILTKMQSATTPGSSKTFKVILANFSKAATDSEKQAQVYQALEHASKGSLSVDIGSLLSAFKNKEVALSSDEQLQLLQDAFQSLLTMSDQDGAVRVMTYIAPLVYRLTPTRELQKYEPPLPKVPSAPPATESNYGPDDRVSQFSGGDQGEVNKKVDKFTLS